MTFKANRLYYFLERKFFKELLPQLGIFLLFILTVILSDGIMVPEDVFSLLLFLLVCNLLHIVMMPNQFTLENDEITLHAWFKKPYHTGGVTIRIGGMRFRYKRVRVTVRRIHRIETSYRGYRKARRVGTLRLYGEILAKNSADDLVEDVQIPSSIEIYGVRDVDAVVGELHAAFPMAEIGDGRR